MLIQDIDFEAVNQTISQVEVVVVHVILAYFGIKHILRKPMQGIQVESPIIEELQTRLRKMPDQKLIEFGRGCRAMCSREANFGQLPLSVWTIQLREARMEWRRRHPK